MTNKKTGKPYEQFVHDIYTILASDDRFTSVEKDVELIGHDGPRQIDVLLRSKVANLELLTVIECRDYTKRLDIIHLDAFHSKLVDVKASKGVLVSRKGFSKKAISKANRVGISLCVADTSDQLLSSIDIQIPIRVSIIESTLSHVSCLIVTERGLSPENSIKCSDSYILYSSSLWTFI